MTFRRDDRFADDVREIGADRKIPVQPDRAQRRAGNETPADAEKPAEDSDQKTNDREINRADLRRGDREHHRDHSERPPCSRRIKPVVTHFEDDRLADDQADGDDGVNVDVSLLEVAEPIRQEMQDGEKITDDEGGIDDQLDQESRQSVLLAFGFIALAPQDFGCASSSAGSASYGKDANIHCAREAFFLTLHDPIRERRNMADVANKYPENVDGKFYVDDQCIDCDLCRETAPANFKRNDDGGHSFVYKQPESPEEEALCKEAMEGCPVEAIGSDGG